MANGFTLTAQLTLAAPTAANTNAVITQLRNQLKGVSVSITGNVSPSLAKSITSTTKATQSLSKAFDEASNSYSKFGEQSALATKRFLAFVLSTTGIIKFIGAISTGVHEAIAFQHEMVKIAQVTNKTVSGISELSDEVTKLSTNLGVNSSKLLEAAQVLAQAGLSAEDTKTSLEALAKSAVSPTFDNIINTTEGAVAIFSQFKIKAEELEGALGSINAVAGKYAVESADIVTAVRRTGGAFKAAGGNLNELSALFTSVRSTTRESAESIATGFRTIFTRLQRSRTIDFLKNLGIELRNSENQFIGPMKAIEELSIALDNIKTTDPRFAQVIEELGGFRQISKVIPLIQEYKTAQEALSVATLGQNSLTKDSIKSQESLQIQLTKVKEEFDALIRSFAQSSTMQSMVNITLNLAKAFIKVADSLEPILPLIAALGLFKIGNVAGSFGRGFGNVWNNLSQAPVRKASGGVVPNGRRSPLSRGTDTVDAVLTPGEYIIKKEAAKKIGYATLDKMNNTRYYAEGGEVEKSKAIKRAKVEKLLRGAYAEFQKQHGLDLGPFEDNVKIKDLFDGAGNTNFDGIDPKQISGLFAPPGNGRAANKTGHVEIFTGANDFQEDGVRPRGDIGRKYIETLTHELTHKLDNMADGGYDYLSEKMIESNPDLSNLNNRNIGKRIKDYETRAGKPASESRKAYYQDIRETIPDLEGRRNAAGKTGQKLDKDEQELYDRIFPQILANIPDEYKVKSSQLLGSSSQEKPKKSIWPKQPIGPDEPPLESGMYRVYHGGGDYDGGKRWVSPHRDYAQGYADKNPQYSSLQYADIPQNHPSLQKSFEDDGTGMAPPMNFEAPEDIAKQLKILKQEKQQKQKKPKSTKLKPAQKKEVEKVKEATQESVIQNVEEVIEETTNETLKAARQYLSNNSQKGTPFEGMGRGNVSKILPPIQAGGIYKGTDEDFFEGLLPIDKRNSSGKFEKPDNPFEQPKPQSTLDAARKFYSYNSQSGTPFEGMGKGTPSPILPPVRKTTLNPEDEGEQAVIDYYKNDTTYQSQQKTQSQIDRARQRRRQADKARRAAAAARTATRFQNSFGNPTTLNGMPFPLPIPGASAPNNTPFSPGGVPPSFYPPYGPGGGSPTYPHGPGGGNGVPPTLNPGSFGPPIIPYKDRTYAKDVEVGNFGPNYLGSSIKQKKNYFGDPSLSGMSRAVSMFGIGGEPIEKRDLAKEAEQRQRNVYAFAGLATATALLSSQFKNLDKATRAFLDGLTQAFSTFLVLRSLSTEVSNYRYKPEELQKAQNILKKNTEAQGVAENKKTRINQGITADKTTIDYLETLTKTKINPADLANMDNIVAGTRAKLSTSPKGSKEQKEALAQYRTEKRTAKFARRIYEGEEQVAKDKAAYENLKQSQANLRNSDPLVSTAAIDAQVDAAREALKVSTSKVASDKDKVVNAANRADKRVKRGEGKRERVERSQRNLTSVSSRAEKFLTDADKTQKRQFAIDLISSGAIATGSISKELGADRIRNKGVESKLYTGGSALEAAGTGAATGSAIGSILGPMGTAVGGALGGLVGAAYGYTTALEQQSNMIAEFDFNRSFKRLTKTLDDISNDFSSLGRTFEAVSTFEDSFRNYDRATGDTRTNLKGTLSNASVGLESLFKKNVTDLAKGGGTEDSISTNLSNVIGKDTLSKFAIITDQLKSDVEQQFSKFIKESVEKQAKVKKFQGAAQDLSIYNDRLKTVPAALSQFNDELKILESNLSLAAGGSVSYADTLSNVSDITEISRDQFSLLLNKAGKGAGFTGQFGNETVGRASQAYEAIQRLPAVLQNASLSGGLTGSGIDFAITDYFKNAGFDPQIVNSISAVVNELIGADLKPENISKALAEDFSGTVKKMSDAVGKHIEPLNSYASVTKKILDYQNKAFSDKRALDAKIEEQLSKELDIREETFNKFADVAGLSGVARGRASDSTNLEKQKLILGNNAGLANNPQAIGALLAQTKQNIDVLKNSIETGTAPDDVKAGYQLNAEVETRDRLVKALQFLTDTANTTAEAQAELASALNASKVRTDLLKERTFGTYQERGEQSRTIGYARQVSSTSNANFVPEDSRRGTLSLLERIGDSVIPEITGAFTGNEVIKRTMYNQAYNEAVGMGYNQQTASQYASALSDPANDNSVQAAFNKFAIAQGAAIKANAALVKSLETDRQKLMSGLLGTFQLFSAKVESIFLKEEQTKLTQQKLDAESKLGGVTSRYNAATKFGGLLQQKVGPGRTVGQQELNSILLQAPKIQESKAYIDKYGAALSGKGLEEFQKKQSQIGDNATGMGTAQAVSTPGGFLGKALLGNSVDFNMFNKLLASTEKDFKASIGGSDLVKGELWSDIQTQIMDSIPKSNGQYHLETKGGFGAGYASTVSEAIARVVDSRKLKLKTERENVADFQKRSGLDDNTQYELFNSAEYKAFAAIFKDTPVSFTDLNTEATNLTTTLKNLNTALGGNAAAQTANQGVIKTQSAAVQAAAKLPQNNPGVGINPGVGVPPIPQGPQAGVQKKAQKPLLFDDDGMVVGQEGDAEESQANFNRWRKQLEDYATANNLKIGENQNGTALFNFAGVNVIDTSGMAYNPKRKYQVGGSVGGSGSGDKIPALVEPGEFILNRNAARAIGHQRLSSINSSIPRFQNGGSVGSTNISNVTNNSIDTEVFSRAIQSFSTSASSLTTALNAFPREITLNAKHTVEVVVNGAQVLQNIMPEVTTLIVNETKGQINRMLKNKFPTVGPM